MKNLIAGETAAIGYTLHTNQGVQDLTGMTVTIDLHDKDGNELTPLGTVSVPTPTSGIAYFNPNTADLSTTLQPYKVRFKVTDGSGRWGYFPDGIPEIWVVYPR